ncbi:MAG: CBS domain-containing protein [Lutisporaceae bacterium]
MKIKEIMTTDVKTISSDDSISEAANIMKTLDIGAVPVVQDNMPIGIVTDRDIIIRGVATGKNSKDAISSIMTTEVITISPDVDVHEAADIMAANQIRRLPIVQDKQLVGIVAIGDLAVETIFENEAGEALHNISMGVKH